MNLDLILGYFNSRLILGIVYIFILIPISFVMKLLKFNPLIEKFSDGKSYRIENKHVTDFKKTF